jgi:hypothetical protein
MKKSIIATVAMVGCLAMGGVAKANVAFDGATGTGFAGKGDVQTVLGYNNAQMQNQVSNLVFTEKSVDTYEVVTAWATGDPDNPVSLNSHTETVTKTAQVQGQLNCDPRHKNQYTGFNLTGRNTSTTTTIGELPVVSPTITYTTFSWTTSKWDGTYDTVANPDYPAKKNAPPTIQVKHYVQEVHTSDQMPAYYDENGQLVLYSEGNNKALVSVTLLDSQVTLQVNGVNLPFTAPLVPAP